MLLKITRQTTKTIDLKITRGAIPATAVVRFLASKTPDQETASDNLVIYYELALSTLTNDERATGEFSFTVPPEKTDVPAGDYYYNIRYLTNPTQEASPQDADMSGKLIISPAITLE